MQAFDGRMGAARVLFSVSIVALGLAACGDKSASLAARDHADAGVLREDSRDYVRQTSAPIRLSSPQRERASAGDDVAWASSARATAGENAQARFDRYGAEFDAETPQAYAAKARDFLRRPPAGAETLDRANGDKLVYDAKSNVFAVANDEGLPRTFFHPRDGATYWSEQKAVEARRADGGERRTSAANRRRSSEG
jgi:pyocin large subunit-like protein